MLKLRWNTEDWRELITGRLLDETLARLDETEVDDLADQLCSETLRRLDDSGVPNEQAHQQSSGAFAIIQAGTQAERAAFESAVDAAIEVLRIPRG